MELGKLSLNSDSATVTCVSLGQLCTTLSLGSFIQTPCCAYRVSVCPTQLDPNRLWLSLQAPATLAIILFLPQAKLRVTPGPLHWNYPLPDFLVTCSFFSFLSQFKCHLLREPLTDHSSHRPSSTTFPGLVFFSVLLTLRNDHICFLCSCFTYIVFVQYSL